MLSPPTVNDTNETATLFAVLHYGSDTIKTAAADWWMNDSVPLDFVLLRSVPAVSAAQECESDIQCAYHTAISENLPECQLPAWFLLPY